MKMLSSTFLAQTAIFSVSDYFTSGFYNMPELLGVAVVPHANEHSQLLTKDKLLPLSPAKLNFDLIPK